MAESKTDPVTGMDAGLTDAQIIARRSADIHADKAPKGEHVKVFILPPGPEPKPENGYSHEANMAAVRQYAINQGMRPTGDVRHVSTKQHENGVSWVLTYAVKVAVAEKLEEPSEPDVVSGSDGTTNTTGGTGHSGDTRDKTGE